MDPECLLYVLKVVDLLSATLSQQIFESKTIFNDLVVKECLGQSQDHLIIQESLEITMTLFSRLKAIDSVTSLIFDFHMIDTLVDNLDGNKSTDKTKVVLKNLNFLFDRCREEDQLLFENCKISFIQLNGTESLKVVAEES